MVNIALTTQQRLEIANGIIAQQAVDCRTLDLLLERCASVMSPEQMAQVGLSVPTPPDVASVLPAGAEVLGVEPAEPTPMAGHKNGQAKDAMPAGKGGG